MITSNNGGKGGGKGTLTPTEKSLLVSQLDDYCRVIIRQLEAYQELLLLLAELIPLLIKKPDFESYVVRWADLMNQLKR